MRLWQAAWDRQGEFVIWAEDPARLEQLYSTDATSADIAPRHPSVCSTAEVLQDLECYEVEHLVEDEIVVLLPSVGDKPLHSPRFGLHVEGEEDGVELRPWLVPAVRLSPEEAVNLLTYNPPSVPEELKLGDSFNYWREVSKLLLEMLTRGRFLPNIRNEDNSWAASWRLLPSKKEDFARLEVLAQAMPPVCRAYQEADASLTPENHELLESFLEKAGDNLIRRFLSRQSLTEELETERNQMRFAEQLSWLRGLTKPNASMQGTEHKLVELEKRLHLWVDKLVPSSERSVLQTCFRLIEPEATASADADWRVEIFLRSRSDEEQILEVTDLWQGEMGFLSEENIRVSQVEEQLLADLGSAVKVFPTLSSTLEEVHPVAVSFSTSDAYIFLKETADLLGELEFHVELPEWWNEAQNRVGLSLNVEPENPKDEQGRTWGVLSAKELLACSWSVAVAGQEFSIDQFRALAESAGPLAKVGETWVELDPGKVNSTVQFLANQAGTTSVTLLEALRLGFGLDGENELLPIVDFKANGWLQQLLDSSRDSLPKAEVPEGFKGTLRPYQQEGLAWLVFLAGVGVGGCLADDMGLGKTVQLLALMEYEREQARQADRPKPAQTLLIVPMSTLDNWEQEAKKFTPDISIYMHHGTTRLAGEAFRQAVDQADLILTTYSLAFRDELLFGSVPWGRIALDEAQNIKNQDAKQTKAIRALARGSMTGIAPLENCQRLALTGTPLENHLDELWSIFDFLNPGFLGSIKEFRTRFAVPIERYQDEEATKNLSSLIQPFLLRRLKSDPTIISDLPDKIEMTINTTLTEEQSILYRTVLDEMIPRFDKAQGIQRKGLVLATITRLKQICNHPALYLGEKDSLGGRSAKLNRLEEILEVVLAEGDKALIFTQYAQMGHILAPHLRQRFDKEVLFLHGGLPKKARDKLVQRFKEKDGPQIFILSLKAGGFGLNLTEANQVIHYDQWWNPAVQEQATDRAYRIGQTSNVQVRTFVTSGTLEERINEMLQRKRELAESVVGSTRSAITQLSTDELRALLSYTGQVSGEEEVL